MRIDSGPLEPTYLFRDTPRTEWGALLQQKRLFLARNLNYDCSKLLEFCEEAEQVWQDLGFASYVAMIRDGFDLVPDEIAIARKWLELNKPEWVIPLPDVLSLAAQAKQAGPLAGHGGNRKSQDQVDIVNLTVGGNDPDYTCRRLLRDRPDLFDRVEAGELSPYAAAIAAGFKKRSISIPLGDVYGAIRRMLKNGYDVQEILEAVLDVAQLGHEARRETEDTQTKGGS
jgi:hypothetical protein